MAAILGLNCRTFQNTSSASGGNPFNAGTPEWTVRNQVTSVTVDGSKATADISSRGGGGYRQKVATLAEGSVSFDLIYDDSTAGKVFFDILDEAYRNGSLLDLFFANGSLEEDSGTGVVGTTTTASDGVRGFRAAFIVSDFSESQELEDANRYSVTLEVSGSEPVPGYYEKTGGGTASYDPVSTS